MRYNCLLPEMMKQIRSNIIMYNSIYRRDELTKKNFKYINRITVELYPNIVPEVVLNFNSEQHCFICVI